MLEQNHLYRRIQHKNLFRTFSRTYSRQAPSRNLHSQNKSRINQNTAYSTSTPLIHTDPAQILRHQKLNTLEYTTPRLQFSTQTAPAFKRSDGFHGVGGAISTTLNITAFQPENTTSYNSYLSNLIENRKQNGSALTNLPLHARKQNFKLKSCSQSKQINFQSEVDQSDFSILQYNKRYQIKRQVQERQQREMEANSKIGLIKYRFKEIGQSQLKSNVGRRIGANLFNKYNRTNQDFIGLKKKQLVNKAFQSP